MKLASMLAVALLLAGCAAPEAQKVEEKKADTQAARKCDDAPTGSNMRRCGPGDRVGVITREELERTGMPSSVGRDAYK